MRSRLPHHSRTPEWAVAVINGMRPIGTLGAFSLAVIIQRMMATLDRIPYGMIALAGRVFPAAVFWQSGQTKVAGWHLKPSTIELFQNEYQLPLIDSTMAAYLSAFSEHLFPLLLVTGLATRFAALVLLLMTVVIEIFVHPNAWPTHGVWATCFLMLIARGPGACSLDHLIARRCKTLAAASA
jgi:putative oxidoreductase